MGKANPDNKVILTEEQQKKILEIWNDTVRRGNKPGLKDIVIAIFGQDYHPRSHQYRVVKEFLANMEVHNGSFIKPILSAEHKSYIINNCQNLSPLEMARELFNNPMLSNLSGEVRTVVDFIENEAGAAVKLIARGMGDLAIDDYVPPKSMVEVADKINKHIKNVNYNHKELTPQQQKHVKSLMKYMHDYNFVHKMNKIHSIKERNFFENSFLKNIYDKDDLTQEELNQYLLIAEEIVMSDRMVTRKNAIDELFTTQAESQDPEKAKFSMSLIESMNTIQKQYDESVKRQLSLYDKLIRKRSDRKETEIKENSSLVQLVQFWKSEEKRKQMVALAELRDKELKEEITRLETLDDLKFQVWGVHPSEII